MSSNEPCFFNDLHVSCCFILRSFISKAAQEAASVSSKHDLDFRIAQAQAEIGEKKRRISTFFFELALPHSAATSIVIVLLILRCS